MAMGDVFQLWNDASNNLIEEFDDEAAALAAVRRRIARRGDDAVRCFSLLRLDAEGGVAAVIDGAHLIAMAHHAPSAAD